MLRDQLKAVNETFDSNDDLYVHQQNRGQLHKILARITDYITVVSGGASTYAELINTGKVRYEVEHIGPTTLSATAMTLTTRPTSPGTATG